MGSYKHIFIGILLIGATVIFARLLHNGALNQSTSTAELIQNDAPQTTPTADLQETTKTQTPSLRERILGRRPNRNQGTDLLELSISDGRTSTEPQAPDTRLITPPQIDVETATTITPSQSLDTAIDPIDAIEVPDFSHLEMAILESDSAPFIAQTDPPKLLKIPDPVEARQPSSQATVETELSSSSLANEIPLPPSHDITPIHISPPDRSFPRQGTRTVKRATGIPFGLTQRARSELVAVHKRSDQVKPAATHFLDHIAKEGDTLQSLSDQYYGRPDFYLDIYLANQNMLRNPSALPPGATIKIPVFQN